MAHQVGQRTQGLFDRYQRVDPVHLVQVDVIDVESAQTVLACLHDPAARQAFSLPLRASMIGERFAHRTPNFCRDDHAVSVAALLHPPADDFLGDSSGIWWPAFIRGPGAVDVGGVDEVAAGFVVGIHHFECAGFVDRPSELHGAQPECVHEQAAAAELGVGVGVYWGKWHECPLWKMEIGRNEREWARRVTAGAKGITTGGCAAVGA